MTEIHKLHDKNTNNTEYTVMTVVAREREDSNAKNGAKRNFIPSVKTEKSQRVQTDTGQETNRV